MTLKGSDLTLRLLSAAVLIPFALFVVWQGGYILLVGCGLFAALMAYEWVRMSASPSMRVLIALSIVPFIVTGMFGTYFGAAALALCAILACFTHPVKVARGIEGFGLLYVAGMPFALYALREGQWDGAAAALIFMGIVWGSDAAAYFSGKTFGGPALHPDSPSKTWSGALGAVIFSTACGVLAAYITGGNYIVWLVTGALISIFTQTGDLFESSLKRHFGVKDAGDFLPGHGGIMDRVDGLGFVCVLTILVFIAIPDYVAVLGLAS